MQVAILEVKTKLWRLDLAYDAPEGREHIFRNDNPECMVITCGTLHLGRALPGEIAECRAVRVSTLLRWWRSLWHLPNPTTRWRVNIEFC